MTPSIGKPFFVEFGELQIASLETTRQFVDDEIRFLAPYMSDIADALDGDSSVTIVHQADDTTIGFRLDEIEIGQISLGEGCLIDKKVASYEAILNLLAPNT